MIKGTKSTLVIKKEIELGLVEVKKYKEFIEYWVYDDGTNGTLNSKTGEYVPGSVEAKKPRELYCIIVCEDNPEHITKDAPVHLLVKGAIFNNTEYPDLTDYLCKTERPPQ
jgi:hypothetical protein